MTNLSNLDPEAKKRYLRATRAINNTENTEEPNRKKSRFDEMDELDITLLGTHTNFKASTP